MSDATTATMRLLSKKLGVAVSDLITWPPQAINGLAAHLDDIEEIPGQQIYSGADDRISVALGVLSVLSTALSHTRTSVDSDLREEAGRYLVRRFREWKAEEESPAK